MATVFPSLNIQVEKRTQENAPERKILEAIRRFKPKCTQTNARRRNAKGVENYRNDSGFNSIQQVPSNIENYEEEVGYNNTKSVSSLQPKYNEYNKEYINTKCVSSSQPKYNECNVEYDNTKSVTRSQSKYNKYNMVCDNTKSVSCWQTKYNTECDNTKSVSSLQPTYNKHNMENDNTKRVSSSQPKYNKHNMEYDNTKSISSWQPKYNNSKSLQPIYNKHNMENDNTKRVSSSQPNYNKHNMEYDNTKSISSSQPKYNMEYNNNKSLQPIYNKPNMEYNSAKSVSSSLLEKSYSQFENSNFFTSSQVWDESPTEHQFKRPFNVQNKKGVIKTLAGNKSLKSKDYPQKEINFADFFDESPFYDDEDKDCAEKNVESPGEKGFSEQNKKGVIKTLAGNKSLKSKDYPQKEINFADFFDESPFYDDENKDCAEENVESPGEKGFSELFDDFYEDDEDVKMNESTNNCKSKKDDEDVKMNENTNNGNSKKDDEDVKIVENTNNCKSKKTEKSAQLKTGVETNIRHITEEGFKNSDANKRTQLKTGVVTNTRLIAEEGFKNSGAIKKTQLKTGVEKNTGLITEEGFKKSYAIKNTQFKTNAEINNWSKQTEENVKNRIELRDSFHDVYKNTGVETNIDFRNVFKNTNNDFCISSQDGVETNIDFRIFFQDVFKNTGAETNIDFQDATKKSQLKTSVESNIDPFKNIVTHVITKKAKRLQDNKELLMRNKSASQGEYNSSEKSGFKINEFFYAGNQIKSNNLFETMRSKPMIELFDKPTKEMGCRAKFVENDGIVFEKNEFSISPGDKLNPTIVANQKNEPLFSSRSITSNQVWDESPNEHQLFSSRSINKSLHQLSSINQGKYEVGKLNSASVSKQNIEGVDQLNSAIAPKKTIEKSHELNSAIAPKKKIEISHELNSAIAPKQKNEGFHELNSPIVFEENIDEVQKKFNQPSGTNNCIFENTGSVFKQELAFIGYQQYPNRNSDPTNNDFMLQRNVFNTDEIFYKEDALVANQQFSKPANIFLGSDDFLQERNILDSDDPFMKGKLTDKSIKGQKQSKMLDTPLNILYEIKKSKNTTKSIFDGNPQLQHQKRVQNWLHEINQSKNIAYEQDTSKNQRACSKQERKIFDASLQNLHEIEKSRNNVKSYTGSFSDEDNQKSAFSKQEKRILDVKIDAPVHIKKSKNYEQAQSFSENVIDEHQQLQHQKNSHPSHQRKTLDDPVQNWLQHSKYIDKNYSENLVDYQLQHQKNACSKQERRILDVEIPDPVQNLYGIEKTKNIAYEQAQSYPENVHQEINVCPSHQRKTFEEPVQNWLHANNIAKSYSGKRVDDKNCKSKSYSENLVGDKDYKSKSSLEKLVDDRNYKSKSSLEKLVDDKDYKSKSSSENFVDDRNYKYKSSSENLVDDPVQNWLYANNIAKSYSGKRVDDKHYKSKSSSENLVDDKYYKSKSSSETLVDDKNYKSKCSSENLVDDKNYKSKCSSENLVDEKNYKSKSSSENLVDDKNYKCKSSSEKLVDDKNYKSKSSSETLVDDKNYKSKSSSENLVDDSNYKSQSSSENLKKLLHTSTKKTSKNKTQSNETEINSNYFSYDNNSKKKLKSNEMNDLNNTKIQFNPQEKLTDFANCLPLSTNETLKDSCNSSHVQNDWFSNKLSPIISKSRSYVFHSKEKERNILLSKSSSLLNNTDDSFFDKILAEHEELKETGIPDRNPLGDKINKNKRDTTLISVDLNQSIYQTQEMEIEDCEIFSEIKENSQQFSAKHKAELIKDNRELAESKDNNSRDCLKFHRERVPLLDLANKVWRKENTSKLNNKEWRKENSSDNESQLDNEAWRKENNSGNKSKLDNKEWRKEINSDNKLQLDNKELRKENHSGKKSQVDNKEWRKENNSRNKSKLDSKEWRKEINSDNKLQLDNKEWRTENHSGNKSQVDNKEWRKENNSGNKSKLDNKDWRKNNHSDDKSELDNKEWRKENNSRLDNIDWRKENSSDNKLKLVNKEGWKEIHSDNKSQLDNKECRKENKSDNKLQLDNKIWRKDNNSDNKPKLDNKEWRKDNNSDNKLQLDNKEWRKENHSDNKSQFDNKEWSKESNSDNKSRLDSREWRKENNSKLDNKEWRKESHSGDKPQVNNKELRKENNSDNKSKLDNNEWRKENYSKLDSEGIDSFDFGNRFEESDTDLTAKIDTIIETLEHSDTIERTEIHLIGNKLENTLGIHSIGNKQENPLGIPSIGNKLGNPLGIPSIGNNPDNPLEIPSIGNNLDNPEEIRFEIIEQPSSFANPLISKKLGQPGTITVKPVSFENILIANNLYNPERIRLEMFEKLASFGNPFIANKLGHPETIRVDNIEKPAGLEKLLVGNKLEMIENPLIANKLGHPETIRVENIENLAGIENKLGHPETIRVENIENPAGFENLLVANKLIENPLIVNKLGVLETGFENLLVANKQENSQTIRCKNIENPASYENFLAAMANNEENSETIRFENIAKPASYENLLVAKILENPVTIKHIENQAIFENPFVTNKPDTIRENPLIPNKIANLFENPFDNKIINPEASFENKLENSETISFEFIGSPLIANKDYFEKIESLSQTKQQSPRVLDVSLEHDFEAAKRLSQESQRLSQSENVFKIGDRELNVCVRKHERVTRDKNGNFIINKPEVIIGLVGECEEENDAGKKRGIGDNENNAKAKRGKSERVSKSKKIKIGLVGEGGGDKKSKRICGYESNSAIEEELSCDVLFETNEQTNVFLEKIKHTQSASCQTNKGRSNRICNETNEQTNESCSVFLETIKRTQSESCQTNKGRSNTICKETNEQTKTEGCNILFEMNKQTIENGNILCDKVNKGGKDLNTRKTNMPNFTSTQKNNIRAKNKQSTENISDKINGNKAVESVFKICAAKYSNTVCINSNKPKGRNGASKSRSRAKSQTSITSENKSRSRAKSQTSITSENKSRSRANSQASIISEPFGNESNIKAIQSTADQTTVSEKITFKKIVAIGKAKRTGVCENSKAIKRSDSNITDLLDKAEQYIQAALNLSQQSLPDLDTTQNSLKNILTDCKKLNTTISSIDGTRKKSKSNRNGKENNQNSGEHQDSEDNLQKSRVTKRRTKPALNESQDSTSTNRDSLQKSRRPKRILNESRDSEAVSTALACLDEDMRLLDKLQKSRLSMYFESTLNKHKTPESQKDIEDEDLYPPSLNGDSLQTNNNDASCSQKRKLTFDSLPQSKLSRTNSSFTYSELLNSMSQPYLQELSSVMAKQSFNESSIDFTQIFDDINAFLLDVKLNPELFSEEAASFEVEVVKTLPLLSQNGSGILAQALSRIVEDQTLLGGNNLAKPATKKGDVLVKIKDVVASLREQMQGGRKAAIALPRYDCWKNVVFMDNTLTYKRGGAQRLIYKDRIGSCRKFKVVVYLLMKVYTLLMSGSNCTKREIYYQIITRINNQKQINSAYDDVCCLLDTPPWILGIMPSSRGMVYGNLTLVINKARINCNNRGGITIPQDINSLSRIETDAKFVLIVEKEACFQKLLDEDIQNKLTQPFILLTGKGYPDTNTRLLAKRLSDHLKLPMFILVDADPFGIEIMLSYRFGTLSTSFLSQELALPHLRWLGIHPSELDLLNISNFKLTQRDVSKIDSILKRPYMESNPKIRWQLQYMKATNSKAEIEGVIKCNHSLSNFYIPNKLCTLDFY